MKNLLLTLSFIMFALGSFAQQSGSTFYGPVPYRTLEQTIGEDYCLLPLIPGTEANGYPIHKKNEVMGFPATAVGKIIKLISIDGNYGHFKDSANVEYVAHVADINHSHYFFSITPLSDIQNAKKMFLNKTLWMRVHEIYEGDGTTRENKKIKYLLTEKVTVIDIKLSSGHNTPFIFILKTATGKAGWIATTISGTNADLAWVTLNKQRFNDIFFTDDPNLKYHFNAETWKWVKMGLVTLGMPPDAVRLIEGDPVEINSSTSASGTREQWVYGLGYEHHYFYFEKGKLIDY